MQNDHTFVLELLQKVALLFIGCYFIIFRRWIARMAVYWNSKICHFAAKEKQYQVVFLIGGIVFFIFGILLLFNVIHFKN
jgi:hypothetical protein